MNELIRKDIEARDRIINDTASSFFVEAGAGSGKTTVLVKRMVGMVETGIDVSKISAITFTKAAAGEFYSRFQDALLKRSKAETKSDFVQEPGELGNPSDESRARCRKALANIDLCFMGTIDSFCNMILSEHPAEAGVPSNARVLSDAEMDALYRREYSRIQNGRHGQELKSMNHAFRSLYKNPNEVFLKTLRMMMERRNAEFACPSVQAGEIDDLFREDRTGVQDLVQQLLAHPESAYEGNDKSRKAWGSLEENSNVLLDSWEGRLWEVIPALQSVKEIRVIPEFDPDQLGRYGHVYFTEHISKGKVGWYEIGEDEIPKLIHKLKDYQYSLTIGFITKCIPVIAEELKAEGGLSFFDYMLYLRDMLKKDAVSGGKLIRHIYERHSYYLIDEFQDTNPIQAEIFFYLTAENPSKDWRKCVPHPGSIFIVGDPKQSIYRFRNADVSSYLHVKELFCPPVGEVLYLSRNFRSTQHMNRWFNRVFKELLSEDTINQSRFEEIPLDEGAGSLSEVVTGAEGKTSVVSEKLFGGVYTYKSVNDSKAPLEDTDPFMTAKVIRNLVYHPDILIKEKNDKAPREIRYGDIMLITPGKTKLHTYTAMFSFYRIPFRVEGKIIFRDCPALKALTAVYLAATFPNESRYLYGALTSAVYSLTEAELLRLKGQGLVLSVFSENIKIPASERVKDILQELRSLYFSATDLSAAGLFSLILEKYDIFRITGTANLEYVYYALELLRAAETSGEASSPEEGARFLENLLNDDNAAERCVSLTRNQDRVHIANLHKVKGLEAPVVILAANPRTIKKPEIRVEQTDNGAKGWVFRVKNGFFGCHTETALYPDEEAEEESSLQAEQDRLLYVAATRARRALIIGDMCTLKGAQAKQSPWQFFVDRSDGELFNTINDQAPYDSAVSEISAVDLYENRKVVDLSDPKIRVQSFGVLRPSQVKTKALTDSEDEFEDVSDADTVRTDQRKRNPALIGTIVHRLMEMLVSSKNTVDLEQAIQEIALDYEAEDSYYTDILRRVGEAIRSGGFPQETFVPQDILTELLSADEVHCEMPFCYREPVKADPHGDDTVISESFRKDVGSESTAGDANTADASAVSAAEIQKALVWHGIMDVVYKKNGSWHIIDYKTNADPDDLDEKYRAQMTAYKAAFRVMTGEEADARVYHINV